MADEKVGADEIQKGLSVLADLAKGHSGKGTPSTEVTSMTGQGGPTQVFHTASNSDPGAWAGSSFSAVPENGTTDSISSNATDYTAQAKMAKSIMDKVAKGEALNAFERTFFKGMMADNAEKGGNPFAKDKEDVDKGGNPFAKDKDKDDDKDKEVVKSLADHAAENETVQKGLEVSEFLAAWATVMTKSLASTKAEIVAEVRRMLVAESSDRGEFNKSLAGAVHALGQGVALQSQRVQQLEATPARGPRSAPSMHVIEKSGPGPQIDSNNPLEGISKSQALTAMVDMVEKSQLHPTEVVKFESTGVLTPELAQRVARSLGR